MSFVRNIFNKMSATSDKESDDDASEETSTESSDTGIFTAVSDLESSGHALDADCSAISNFFGYCFFRRSKKEPDSPAKESKRSKDASKENTASPAHKHKEMCKNNITIQNFESAPHSSSVTDAAEVARCPETDDCASASAEKSETNATNESDMEWNANRKDVASRAQTYLNLVKTLEPPHPNERRGSGVKPCGHGTVAVSPKIPWLQGGRRDNSSTPPESPKPEAKRKLSDTFDAIPEKEDKLRKGDLDNGTPSELFKRQVNNDTVMGSMKLHVELPVEPSKANPPAERVNITDSEKKNLINQEAKFQSQLNDLSKQLALRDAEANKLRFQMEELQRDVFAKSAGVDQQSTLGKALDGKKLVSSCSVDSCFSDEEPSDSIQCLEAELQAAQKESECVRQRLRILESDLAQYRQKNQELEEQLGQKTDLYTGYEKEATKKIAHLQGIIQELQNKIETLESQLETLKLEKSQLEEKYAILSEERESEKRLLQETIEEASKEKEKIDKKWQIDFEKLRTINIMKEQQLLDDFEWKLREVEQKCKKRLEDEERKIDERLQEAYKDAYEKMQKAENMMSEVENLRAYEKEVRQLRGLTREQEKSIGIMLQQQEEMKIAEESLRNETKRLRNLIEIEKENLQHMQRIHHQELNDRERKLRQTLEQKKTEIAMYWEERLLHECGRLKNELEQLHNEEKASALDTVRKEKDREFVIAKKAWEQKIQECVKEISALKKSIKEREDFYHNELISNQTKTDRDILELRRTMDKIDMIHHEKFEQLVQEHDKEIEQINIEHERKLQEVEETYQKEISQLRNTLVNVKEQMEHESQVKLQNLIQQHRAELDMQWENLIHQKSEAIKLVEDDYVTKYKTLEEQFYTQQKSHTSREIELLKTIDALKNDLSSKDSTIDDLQSNIDTLEGGVQVLHQEIAQLSEQLLKTKQEAEQKIRNLQEAILKLQEQKGQDEERYRTKMFEMQKQSQTTIDQLQRKCQCLTKLFEEVRARYERRESRQEDLNLISDLRQIISEQEKDLACINEEKRYFQMKLMSLEKSMEPKDEDDEEAFVDCSRDLPEEASEGGASSSDCFLSYPNFLPQINGPLNTFTIPPTIQECDDCDD